jgi:hypothetical protein
MWSAAPGMDNRRFAVVTADWESVGGARTPAPELTPAGADLDHRESDLGRGRNCSRHSSRPSWSSEFTTKIGS